MSPWDELSSAEVVDNTINSLSQNNITAEVFADEESLKNRLWQLIPPGAIVMTMASTTLNDLGITDEINFSGRFEAVHPKLSQPAQYPEARHIASLPDYAIGSVHAVTRDGRVVIALATGSQLPANVYGAKKVIWVVGTQKIVSDLKMAMERIEKYTFPLEDARSLKVYGQHSGINKVLVINRLVGF